MNSYGTYDHAPMATNSDDHGPDDEERDLTGMTNFEGRWVPDRVYDGIMRLQRLEKALESHAMQDAMDGFMVEVSAEGPFLIREEA